MANEIQVTGQLQYTNPTAGIPQQLVGLVGALFSIAGKNFQAGSESVDFSAASAVPLGGVTTAGGWAIFINRDPTNYVKLLTGTSGTVFARMNPGECALFRFDASVTAPAWQAHSAACLVQYMILET